MEAYNYTGEIDPKIFRLIKQDYYVRWGMAGDISATPQDPAPPKIKNVVNLRFNMPQTVTLILEMPTRETPADQYFRARFGSDGAVTTVDLEPGIHTLQGANIEVDAVNEKEWTMIAPLSGCTFIGHACITEGAPVNWTEVP